MAISTKSGQLMKNGTAIKYWYQHFAVLSGAYIYFYDHQTDLHP
jgi:hypothetical protein